MRPLSNPCLSVCICTLQRVLEAEENGDGFHDDEDFELDTPKRKNRNRGKVSVERKDLYMTVCVLNCNAMQYNTIQKNCHISTKSK